VTNNTGEKIEYGYNLNGDMTSSTVKSPANVITKQMSMAYDELGRLMRSIGAATQTTTLSYDRTDLQVQTKDPRNNLYGYSYDSLQRLIHTQDQAGGEVTLTRDGQDNISSYRDDRTITTSYVRNGFGEVIQEVSPDAGTTTFTRDLRGLVTSETDGRGIVTNRTYDPAGRMLTETYPAATTENVTYTYDNTTTPAGNKGRGRLTRIADQSGSTAYVYNALGQIITDTRVIGTQTYVTGYLYNDAGKVTQITYPSGRIVIIARNSNGQVTGVTTKQTSAAAAINVATGLTYAPMSNLLTAMTHGNGLITTAGYDLDYRLSSLNVKDGATNVSALAYAYTDGMNLTGITDGVTAANSNTLGYSLANRLNAATGPWGSKSFGYDGVGNRITDNTTLSGTTTNRTQFYGTNDNRLGSIYENTTTQIRSYTYDNAGNTVTETRPGESFAYSYNKRNRLSAVTRNTASYATYGYNALEQLTTRTTTAAGGPVGQVAYTYDLDGHLITEAVGTSGVKTREYIWLPSNDNSPVDLPLAVIDVATNTISYVHADHLGRPIRMTNAAKATVWQATWKPWGEVQTLSGTNTNNVRYPGQYFQIETGLHYNHHRMYDPVTGRYTQPDPLRFVDGPSVYAYAKNSPLMRTDRNGLTIDPKSFASPAPELPHSSVPKPNAGQMCGDVIRICILESSGPAGDFGTRCNYSGGGDGPYPEIILDGRGAGCKAFIKC
jgi:RHS repeat-associated protein